jgi:hypothetical protein
MAREVLRVHDEYTAMRAHLDEVNAQNQRLILRVAAAEAALATAEERLQRQSAWLRMRAWIAEALHV